jgi:DNA-binding NarL/FixJ family response regulator
MPLAGSTVDVMDALRAVRFTHGEVDAPGGTDSATRDAATAGLTEIRAALEAGLPVRRDALRMVVFAWDTARCRRRAVAGQGLWAALVVGRWSLLDTFLAGGTRYAVARKHRDDAAPRRALLPRQRIVLELALAGRSGKWMALELALSESVVARTLRAAVRKIGAASTAALTGLQTAVFEPLDGVDGDPDLAVARLEPAGRSMARLSKAERAVLTCVLGGRRITDVAHERGTSSRTVAHQLSSVYRKLGVGSRRELFAHLAR